MVFGGMEVWISYFVFARKLVFLELWERKNALIAGNGLIGTRIYWIAVPIAENHWEAPTWSTRKKERRKKKPMKNNGFSILRTPIVRS